MARMHVTSTRARRESTRATPIDRDGMSRERKFASGVCGFETFVTAGDELFWKRTRALLAL